MFWLQAEEAFSDTWRACWSHPWRKLSSAFYKNEVKILSIQMGLTAQLESVDLMFLFARGHPDIFFVQETDLKKTDPWKISEDTL